MRHYEIVLMVHPDQSDQVADMVDRYTKLIKTGGQVHRMEDWGRRLLAYPIEKLHKAHYILLNVECNSEVMLELKANFKYNDAILRHLIIRCSQAVSTESPIMLQKIKAEATNEEAKAEAGAVSEGGKAEEAIAEEDKEAEAEEFIAEEAAEPFSDTEDTKSNEPA